MHRNLWDQIDENLYDVLGIPADADDDQITAAWRAAAKANHPDVGGSVAQFQRAEIAYQVLSDPPERSRYDRHLAQHYATAQSANSYAGATTSGANPRAYEQQRSQPGFTYATFDPRTGGYTYSTVYFGADPQRAPQSKARKPRGVWWWLFWSLILIAALFTAIAMTILLPIVLIALVIWLVGRALNPRESRGQ